MLRVSLTSTFVACLIVSTNLLSASSPESRGVASTRLVDRFGQSVRKEYPGKVREAAELRLAARQETDELAKFAPAPRDSFGGLPGSGEKYALRATGFFRVGNAEGRDVMVTPEGNVFFQLGVCCLLPLDDYTYVRGRESAYEWIPDQSGVFASAWLPDGTPAVSFYLANWVRKFELPFDLESWASQYIRRLRAWGFNSGGAWSRPTRAGTQAKFPIARMLPIPPDLPVLPGSHGLWDSFAPNAAASLDRLFAERIAPDKNNPLIIGYFLGNEQLFENVPKIVPSSGSDSPAKRRLVELLRERYSGNIQAFNTAWALLTPVQGFDELVARKLTVVTAQAAEDVQRFTELFYEQHYRLIMEAFRRHDPNHLLLGSRWQPGTANQEALVRIAARFVDVISVNYYTYAIERSFLDRIHTRSGGRPLLLSEWYFGCTDEGLNGGKEIENQHARGQAYRHYVENAAALSYVVGHEWFSYVDQPVTGRYLPGSPRLYDGEGNNTGLVNVVDRPYRELVTAAATTNARIYDVMFGRTAPFQFNDPRFAAGQSPHRVRVVTAPRAESALKIDGIMADWPGRPGEPIDSRRTVIGQNADNFSADFRLCWDDENLYLFVQVQDPTPALNQQAESNFWSGDAIEIFLGTGALDTDGPLRLNDCHLIVRASANASVLVHRENESVPPGVVASVTRNVAGDGYAVEIALPWRELHVTPEAGRELLFDLGIDESIDGVTRARQLMWSGTERNSSERGAWGRLRLIAN